MSAFSDQEPSSLEEEYIKIKRTLYRKLFKYMIGSFLVTILVDVFRTVFYLKTSFPPSLIILLIFGVVFTKFILDLKSHQEVVITIFFVLKYLGVMLAHYYGNTGLFENPLDSFYLAYGSALIDRLIVTRIPKSSYRTAFSILTTLIRILIVPSNDKAIFSVQFLSLFFGIYLDHDKEKYDHDLFASYYNSNEQLVQFKNLVVNDIPEGIMIVSWDLTRTIFANNSFTDLLGVNYTSNIRNQLRHFHLSDNISGAGSNINDDPRQSLLTFLEENLQGGGKQTLLNQKISCNLVYNVPVPLEENDQAQQGLTHLLEAKIFPLVWDQQQAVAIILHDVTQQHTIMHLKVANAQKDVILATVSHELRTPLNGMLGMIQVMQKGIMSQDMAQCLDICHKNGNLLMGLVNSILDLNELRSNTLKLYPDKVDIKEILGNIVGLYEFQCQQKGLYVKAEIPKEIKELIITDKNRLSQVFINLVGNALKFTRQGGITITAVELENGEYIEFSVKDTGIGIKDEDRRKLLKQLGNLEEINPQGVGLGLTISNSLANLLCCNEEVGGIRVKSKYRFGSIFSFVIKKKLNQTFYRRTTQLRPSMPPFEDNGDIEYKVRTHLTPVLKKPIITPTTNTTSKVIKMSTLSHMWSQSNLFDTNNRYSSNGFKEASGILSKQEVSEKTGSGPTVVIVDDNPFNIAVADCLVTHQGYNVVSALYGQTAIDLILKNNHDTTPIKLILMDLQMPVMDGYETTRLLRKMMGDKKIPEIPIVPLTANDSEADKQACRKVGMVDHLSKPLKEVELVRVLKMYG